MAKDDFFPEKVIGSGLLGTLVGFTLTAPVFCVTSAGGGVGGETRCEGLIPLVTSWLAATTVGFVLGAVVAAVYYAVRRPG